MLASVYGRVSWKNRIYEFSALQTSFVSDHSCYALWAGEQGGGFRHAARASSSAYGSKLLRLGVNQSLVRRRHIPGLRRRLHSQPAHSRGAAAWAEPGAVADWMRAFMPQVSHRSA